MKILTTRRVLQINEWGRVRCDLNAREKSALQARARAWQLQNNLSAPPLWFEGAGGEWLRARHYVGMLEADNITLEIWPKLDNENASRHNVMRNFLWLLEVANSNLKSADEAQLQNAPLEFHDIFALLFARRLWPELQDGLPVEYQSQSNDLPLVRGRIHFVRQLTKNWDRRDQIACVWDELQVDTPLTRLLKCACKLLASRVQNPLASSLLDDCLNHLSDAADSSPREVLRETISFHRHTQRFAFCAAFARRILENVAYEMTAGDAAGFSFLLDMNAVFEDYTRAALQAHFGTFVSFQHEVGALLRAPRAAISQRADFRWRVQNQSQNHTWLGDAKYKTPTALPDADDVRQITVYGEIEGRKNQVLPHLALLYPFGGGAFEVKISRAWNDALLSLVPVDLCPPNRNLRAALPENW